jgi:alpha-tubulin suppressor-like RCC1 family protein
MPLATGVRPLYRRQSASALLKNIRQTQSYGRKYSSNGSPPNIGRSTSTRRTGLLLSAILGAGTVYAISYARAPEAKAPVPPTEVKFEQERKKPASAEENRESLSSQHIQIKKSWENPGVFAWGSNTGHVVAPDSNEPTIKAPRRISYFDGIVLRDLKLDRNFGAAVTENGDVLQWGAGYSTDFPSPIMTLSGQNITKISLSKDRVIALASNGSVFSLPVSRKVQLEGPRPQQSSWLGLWSSKSTISYEEIKIPNLSFGEKVSNISSGQEHCLLLTSAGRLFSSATSHSSFPSKGQLGIPGLMRSVLPAGEIRHHPAHEIESLKGTRISKIATGDYHSVCIDDCGQIFAFGDNAAGQLGTEPTPEKSHIDAPFPLPVDKLYSGSNLTPFVTDVAAGGDDTFFTVDAKPSVPDLDGLGAAQTTSRITADTWSCGTGIYGTLGNSRWTHIQGVPSKIKALSGLYEYDESTNTAVPIHVRHLSIGATHASAQMANVTNIVVDQSSTQTGSLNETNYGADVLFWGGNEFYQLGTGRRNNVSTPTYIASLDARHDRDIGRRADYRFQVAPKKKIVVSGRTVEIEQRVECGRGVTAVYSAI